MHLPKRLTWEMLERIIADAVMVNLALLSALFLRFIFLFVSKNSDPWVSVAFYNAIFQESVRAYRNSAWLLTLICLVTFYLSGFYTHGRAYRSRYKALIISQAVSLSYLIFGFLSYFFKPLSPIPRGALALGWLITLALVGGARVAATLWTATVLTERKMRVGDFGGIKNVLVVGGAGYLGSVVVSKLLRKGYRVRVLDVLMYGDAAMAELDGHPRFEFERGDFRNIETVVKCMQDMDAVVHLGAIVGDPASDLDQDFTIEVNLAATRMIAEVAKGYGVQRFVFASTCAVYGASDEVLNERSALKPVSLYSKTKLRSEEVLLSLADSSFSPIVLRFATMCGLSYRPRFDLVVNLLAAKAVCEREITIFGGDQWRPFIHVDDAAEAIIRCLEAPLANVKGQIFNVVSENYRIRQIGEIIKELLPGTVVHIEEGKVDRRNYHVSFDKIKKKLNFVPMKSVRDAILEIKEAFERGEITDYSANEYSNYRFLSEESNFKTIKWRSITSLLARVPLEPSKPPYDVSARQDAATSPSPGGPPV